MDGSFSMTEVLVQEQVMAEQRKMLMIIMIMNRTARAIASIQSQGGYQLHSRRAVVETEKCYISEPTFFYKKNWMPPTCVVARRKHRWALLVPKGHYTLAEFSASIDYNWLRLRPYSTSSAYSLTTLQDGLYNSAQNAMASTIVHRMPWPLQ